MSQPDLILNRCHEISLFSPVDGFRVWAVCFHVIPFGGRAVLQWQEQWKSPEKKENIKWLFFLLFSLYMELYLWFRPEEMLFKLDKGHVWKLVQPHCSRRLKTPLILYHWFNNKALQRCSYWWKSGFLDCVYQSFSCSQWISAVYGRTPARCTLCYTVQERFAIFVENNSFTNTDFIPLIWKNLTKRFNQTYQSRPWFELLFICVYK